MTSRTVSTAAAALFLVLAPMTVPDIAAASTSAVGATSTEEHPDETEVLEPEERPDEPIEPIEPPSVPTTPTDGPDRATSDSSSTGDAAPAVEAATTPTPTAEPSSTPSAPMTPTADASPDETTPNETQVDLYVVGAGDVTGQPGQAFATSIFNIKNSSSITIPSRTLDIHWSLDGPGTFNGRPFSVANSGTANVTGCTFTTPKQTDCVGANPQSMNTGSANYNHIRVPVKVDDDALPGDVVIVNGYFEPNASTDYVNSNPQTSSTWSITIPLTAAVIDEPAAAVGPRPTVTGSGVAGGTVDVTIGDQPVVTVDVREDGNWSVPVTTALPSGPATVTAVQHRNGFTAEATTATLDVDATAPAQPAVDDPGTVIDPTGPITGSAEPGSTVIVRDADGTELGRGEADETGDFSVRLDAPLPEGSNDLEVVAVDPVGNESDPTPATAIVADTTAPDAPHVERQDLATSAGPVVGTAEPGSTVIVRDTDGNELGRGDADEDGDFRVELDEPLVEGDHDVQVVARDQDGNESDPTDVTVTAPDVTAPEPPVSTTPEFLADGTGPFTGSAETGSTVIVRDADGTELGRGDVGEDGQFRIVLDEPLADGAHDLELVTEDASGNVSQPAPITVDVDESAPNPPVMTSPTELADGAGPITGTAEPGATVIVRDVDGTELGRGTADDNGDFEITLDEPLTDGDHHLELIAQDTVGNTSTPTPTDLTIDTQAPDAPVLEAFDDIVDGTGVVRGTAEPGSTVIIRDADGREIGRGTADAEGHFAFRTTVPLATGAHLLSVVAVDGVGNVSPGSSMLVTLVPDRDGDTGPGVTEPVVTLPGTVAQPTAPSSTIGIERSAGTTATDERADRDLASAKGATGELAFTGAELGGWLTAGLAAIGLGALIRLLGRRRDRGHTQH